MKTLARRQFPTSRMRRMRSDEASRRLQRETQLTTDDLILPTFTCEDAAMAGPIASMPGCERLTLDGLQKQAAAAMEFDIPGIMIFPATKMEDKSLDARAAFNENGVVQKAIRLLKKQYPDLLVFSDIALDPYTSHGQDGIVDARGRIDNDTTVAVLCQQALSHAAAGADVVSPSDMMDGRIGMIRQALDKAGFQHTKILSYAAKYASSFYGPFRDAVGSAKALGNADKKSYQMDPANIREALAEAEMDLAEGADMILVKPALPYLDVIRTLKETLHAPTFAYQVSGEYAMIKAAAQQGWVNEKAAVMESLLCCKRAGADAIISYYALNAASWLREF